MCRLYDPAYLRGRWFDDSVKGWRWCWRSLFMQKIVGYNRHVPFPVSHRNTVGLVQNIAFHPDDLNNFQNFGCYFQSYGASIVLGRGTYVAPNVGLITQNHVPGSPERHGEGRAISIGEKCWIGMNAVVLPGVELGPRTTVGAGSVVTKSFPEGHCVIAGNPARIVRLENHL